jgi:hypothetical protein
MAKSNGLVFSFPLRIDFRELRKQKQQLLDLMADAKALGGEHVKKAENLEGLVHLIDAIQDHAVNYEGLPEREVFDLEAESK